MGSAEWGRGNAECGNIRQRAWGREYGGDGRVEGGMVRGWEGGI